MAIQSIVTLVLTIGATGEAAEPVGEVMDVPSVLNDWLTEKSTAVRLAVTFVTTVLLTTLVGAKKGWSKSPPTELEQKSEVLDATDPTVVVDLFSDPTTSCWLAVETAESAEPVTRVASVRTVIVPCAPKTLRTACVVLLLTILT